MRPRSRLKRSKHSKPSPVSIAAVAKVASASVPSEPSTSASNAKASAASETKPAQPESSSSASAEEVAVSGGDWQDNEAILAECTEAMEEFHKGYTEKGFELIEKAMEKYPYSGLAYRLHASMCEAQYYEYKRREDAEESKDNLLEGLTSAFKAVAFSPNSIEYFLFFVNIFLKQSSVEIKEYQALREVCKDALLVEDPVDLPDSIGAILSSVGGGRIAEVQRQLRDAIKRTITLEERRKEVEQKVAAARLEQETNSTGVPRKDCTTSRSTPLTKTADQKTVLNKELPDCVTQDEQRKEAELSVEQKTSSASHEAGEARKNCSTSGSTPTSEPTDHKIAVNEEVHGQLTQDEPKKAVELTVAGAGQGQKHEAGKAQKHGSTSESTPATEPADKKIIINEEEEEEEEEEEVPEIQDAQMKEVELVAAAHETGQSAPAVESAGQNIVINEEVADADDGLPADQNAVMNEQVNNTEWASTDDGISFGLTASPSPSREEILQYISQKIHEKIYKRKDSYFFP